MKKEIFDILEKYKDGKTRNDKEMANIIGGREHEGEVKEFMKEDWADIIQDCHGISKNLTPVLNKIHHLLRINESEHKNNWKQKAIKWYSYAAAILLIPILVASVSYVFINNRMNSKMLSEVTTIFIDAPKGRLVHFDLPDGTSGVLHGGSKLSYQLPFKNNRNLQLKGQAYFDVIHDENHPFAVHTKAMKVTDLGTRFEIKAFDDEDFYSVLLEQGKVICEVPSIAKKILLNPDHELSVNNKKLQVEKVNAQDLLKWKDGLLVFRDETMAEVAKELERWYNVEVTIEDEVLKDYTFRATFNNEPIEEVLNLLSRTSPLKYKIDKRKVNEDGLYYQKHIKIYKLK